MTMTKTTLGTSNVLLPNLKLLKIFSILFFSVFSIQALADPYPRTTTTDKISHGAVGITEIDFNTADFLPDPYLPVDTTIRGRIVDSAGAPLSGVSVLLKGTNRGTVTDASGNFTLAGVPEGSTVVISMV